MVDVTKQTYGKRIEKSPEFAKEVIVTFTDDISVDTMKLFNEGGEENKWMNPMLKELILDWNLEDENGVKLPITLEGLDQIKSIKMRNWIIETLREIIVGEISSLKKK